MHRIKNHAHYKDIMKHFPTQTEKKLRNLIFFHLELKKSPHYYSHEENNVQANVSYMTTLFTDFSLAF